MQFTASLMTLCKCDEKHGFKSRLAACDQATVAVAVAAQQYTMAPLGQPVADL
jgi:hypothetical protein